ncbi:MAG: valine--tRNA ligase [Clostridiaceae bacterium]|nr:valine--tRNA ligase [Clostridiaceae bacterium]
MKKMDSVPKYFDPAAEEERLYEMWMESGAFHAEAPSDKRPFTIMMPPPNITGVLHMGHALDTSIPDALIRYHRLLGDNALFLPGTDHASIATEARVTAAIEAEGLSKEELGREGFLKRTWKWKDQYNNRIIDQQKRLGISCDWDRHRFTLDEGLSKAVVEVFVCLYEEGLIYRGERMINWCPGCLTSISDIEVEHEEQEGALYYITYPFVDGEGGISIATTRPETMLADTAVAVNPEDERFKDLLGCKLHLPLTDRIIPIIADDYVDMEFGTGCVKITPAHDPNDYEVGLRHNLPIISILTETANMTEDTGKYAGMDVMTARKAVVADLKEQGLLTEVEEIRHNVGTCSRCGSLIEAKPSLQWFVKMEPLAKPAIDAVRNGETDFVPQRFEKIYFNWMENVRDWCISRQLWWGHRIPAWYCSDCGELIVAREEPTKCPKCKSSGLTRDEDTLDTWFSSALWPFSTLGWPEDTVDYRTFYPTDVIVPGYDIIFFWVARMIFSAIEHTGRVPFKKVLIHGMVLDSQGRKMTKSLNNGIDPLEIIDIYGADALRFSLIYGTAPGNDMRFREEKVEAGRNFMNKLWNAFRFVLMNLDDDRDYRDVTAEMLEVEDRWILHEAHHAIKDVGAYLDKLELGLAQERVYQFIWDLYCDWYIEFVKERLHQGGTSGRAAQKVLFDVLQVIIKLLHPFMPYVTEAIHEHLDLDGLLISSSWPRYEEYPTDNEAESTMDCLMEAIRAVRNLRADYQLPSSKKVNAVVKAEDTIAQRLLDGEDMLSRLAGIGEIRSAAEAEAVEDGVSVQFPGGELLISMRELVDIKDEIQRLEGEKERIKKEIQRSRGMLNNKNFVDRAPEEVVNNEKAKLERYQSELEQAEERIETLRSML